MDSSDDNMDYSVGSLADLISGSNTPNKPKVVQKEFEFSANKKRQSSENEGKEKSDSSEIQSPSPGKKVKGNPIPKQPKKKPTDRVATRENRKLLKQNKKEQINFFEDRTVFVGNVSVSENKNQIAKLFSKFGEVDTVRLRSAPVADPRTPKKVAIIKKKFHKNRTTLHCYVRFKTREDALKSLELNGFKYKDHHLRVNMTDNTENGDQSKSIFVGNIKFEAEEEDLWKLFEVCGPIDGIRIVRDRRTDIGKGFGYVNFKTADAVELALQMENVVLKGRELRIKACNASAAMKSKTNKKGRQYNVGKDQKKKLVSTKSNEAETGGDDKGIKTDSGDTESPDMNKNKAKKFEKPTNTQGVDTSTNKPNTGGSGNETKNKKVLKGTPGKCVLAPAFQGRTPGKCVLAPAFQGKQSAEKKKKKFVKGARQKKILIKKIAPKS